MVFKVMAGPFQGVIQFSWVLMLLNFCFSTFNLSSITGALGGDISKKPRRAEKELLFSTPFCVVLFVNKNLFCITQDKIGTSVYRVQ